VTAVLEIDGVAKSYGAGAGEVRALGGVDLSVPTGVVYGLLGPNGAGKSTLLRIVLGLVSTSAGRFRLLGQERVDASVLRRIGSLIEAPALYPFLTARETLELLGRTSGFVDRARIDEVLARVGLVEAADRRVRGFSLGMKQRLGVAAALLTRPELLILDEPTNGLDPAGIQEMRVLMRELAREGLTVILSSHLMEEVQKTCDRVAILDRGAVVAEGGVAELLAANTVLRLRASPVEKVLGLLGGRARADGDVIVVEARPEDAAGIVRSLVGAGVDVHEVRPSALSLEDLFLSLTRRA
jgi:ABC-2 type transport system ATP-binding protein